MESLFIMICAHQLRSILLQYIPSIQWSIWTYSNYSILNRFTVCGKDGILIYFGYGHYLRHQQSGMNSREYLITEITRFFSQIKTTCLYFTKKQEQTINLNEFIIIPHSRYQIHTKGLGLACINYQGIKSNQLIIPYLGEIYQPWRWYEKQDFIKKQMKDYNQKDVLPDFYNIMLDIHKNDPKGIDYLFVDPMSHSCNPNCGTVTCVSNGKYVIGMYAMRDIKYGEELTLDYCSTTESKAEYQQALCLCGYEKCKVRYLQLSNSKEYNAILDKEHCFLSRNAILLKACTQDGIHDEELLKKYKLGKSVFEDLPPWLHSWAVQVLQFIDTEKTLYKAELDCKYAQDYDTNKWNGLVVQQHCDDRCLVKYLIIYMIFKIFNSSQPLHCPIGATIILSCSSSPPVIIYFPSRENYVEHTAFV